MAQSGADGLSPAMDTGSAAITRPAAAAAATAAPFTPTLPPAGELTTSPVVAETRGTAPSSHARSSSLEFASSGSPQTPPAYTLNPPPSRSVLQSATCLPQSRRLHSLSVQQGGSSGLSPLSLRTWASGSNPFSSSASSSPRSSCLFPVRHLRRVRADGTQHSPSPEDDQDSEYDEYHNLTGGVDPYEGEAPDELLKLDITATLASHMLGFASHKIQRLGELTCSGLMSFSVIFSLFAEPIRLGYAPHSWDSTFLVCTITVLALFLVEAFIYWYFSSFVQAQATPSSISPSPISAPIKPESLLPPTSFENMQQEDAAASEPSPSAQAVTINSLASFVSWICFSDTSPVLRLQSLLPSSWSLEVVLDYLSIVSLVPDILDIAQIVVLTRIQRDFLLIGKAGFLIRLIALIRCIPIDIFQLWIHVSDGRWWTSLMKQTSRQVVVGLRHMPSPIRMSVRNLNLKANFGFHMGVVDLAAEPPVTQPTEGTPESSPRFPSPVSRSDSSPSLIRRVLSATPTPVSATSPWSSSTPPTPHHRGVNRIPSFGSESRSPIGEGQLIAPDGTAQPRLPELLGSRPSSRTSSGFASTAPFSPQISLARVLSTNQLMHHRSPMLLHRTLSAVAGGAVSAQAPAPISCSANKLISLSAMSPMAHRRALSSSDSNTSSPLSGGLPPPTPQPQPPSMAIPSHVTRGLSLPVTSSPLQTLRREIGLPHAANRHAPPVMDAAALAAHALSPHLTIPSRMINLSSMSPMVSSRALMAKQAQLAAAAAAGASSGSGVPPVPVHPIAQVSPLSRIRSLGLPPSSMQSSPVPSSRALTGLAALRELHAQQAQAEQQARATNLTPPLMNQPLSGSALSSSSTPTMETQAMTSRSACTSPAPTLRKRRSTISSMSDHEPASATPTSRGGSPTLFHDDVDHDGDLSHLEGPAESPVSPTPTSATPSAQFSHASQIGQLLSDYTAHRAILCLLLVLFLWNVTNTLHVDERPRFGLERIQHYLGPSYARLGPYRFTHTDPVEHEGAFTPMVSSLIRRYQASWSPHLLLLRVGSHVFLNRTDRISSLRQEEMRVLRTHDCESVIDTHVYSQLNARFDLWAMTWLILMLPVLLCVIYKDVHHAVTPIERMVSFVTNLAHDPLSQLSTMRGTSDSTSTPTLDPTLIVDVRRELSSMAGEGELGMTPLMRAHQMAVAPQCHPIMASSFVEVTLQKLVVLLQVGFGSAGAEIIAQNIIGDDLDPMIPGSKVFAVFGFCDITDFNKCTETLEESIMLFVNQIASIVHDSCQHFGGSVNKNIGSSFLLVWKFDPADMKALKAAMHHTQHGSKLPRHGGTPYATPMLHAESIKSAITPLTPFSLGQPFPRQSIPTPAAPRLLPPALARERSASMRLNTSQPKQVGTPRPLTPTQLSMQLLEAASSNNQEDEPIIHRPVERPRLDPFLAQLTLANLKSHETHHAAVAAADATQRRPTSRSLVSRRLSESVDDPPGSQSSTTGDTEEFALLKPKRHSLKRAVSDVTAAIARQIATRSVESHSSEDHDESSVPELILPPAATLGDSLDEEHSIGRGELILKTSSTSVLLPPSSREGTPIRRLSTMTTDSHVSQFGSSLDSSAVSSASASNVPSPMHHTFAPSSHASSAMSRLFQLDTDSLKSSPRHLDLKNVQQAIRTPLRHSRRMSQSFVPSPSVIDENEHPAPSPEDDELPQPSPELEEEQQASKPVLEKNLPLVDPDSDSAEAVELNSTDTPSSTSTSNALPPSHPQSPSVSAHSLFTSTNSPPPSVESMRVSSAPQRLPGGAYSDTPVPPVDDVPTRVSMQEKPRLAGPLSSRVQRSDSFASLGSLTSSTSIAARPVAPSPAVRTTVHRIAHQALSAFLSTIIQIATATSMTRWRTDPLLKARMPVGYDGPALGFGLHVGWAIEGAIGSSHKIDASYLSPNVNLAARLCSATRQYRIPFLFSGPFYKLLDANIQKRCRHLDQVLLKGSSQPMDLYTFDITPGWKHAAAAAAVVATVTATSKVSPTARTTTAAPAAPSPDEPNYTQLRAEWLHQVASINFKLPARKPSTSSSAVHENAAAAATAANEASAGNNVSSTPDGPQVQQSAPSGPASAASTPQQPHRNGTSDLGDSTTARKASNPENQALDSANAAVIDQLNMLLAQLQVDLPDRYVELFNRGTRHYVNGNWQVAGKYLVQFQAMHREYLAAAAAKEAVRTGVATPLDFSTVDGPSNLILQYMGKHAFQAPKGWKGCRKLEKK